jgi:hypothetical protein
LVRDGWWHRGKRKRALVLGGALAIVVLGVVIPVALANSTTGWSTPVYLSANASGETADVPAVALSNGSGVGTLAATWLNTVAGAGITTTSLDSTFDDPGGSGFSPPSSAGFADPIGALDADDQQVAEDGNGDATAVWIENAADNGQNNGAIDGSVMSAYESKGSDHFGTATTIQAGVSTVKNSEPHVAFDASGDAVAVWAQLDGANASGGTWSVEYAIAPAGSGGTFGAAQTLVSDLASDPQPDLAIGQSGSAESGGDNATVVYVVPGTGTGTGLWASQTNLGTSTSLTAANNVYSPGDTLAQPVVAVDTTGDSVIAWVDSGTVYEDLLSSGDKEFLSSVPPDYIAGGGDQSDPQIAVMPTVNSDPETAVSFYDAATGTVDVAAQSGGNAADLNGWEDNNAPVETEATTIPQQPQLSIQEDGAVTMLWETSTAVDAITSGSAPTVSDTPSFSGSPQAVASGVTIPSCDVDSCDALASDNSGDLAAVWLQQDSSSNIQVAASCYYPAIGSTGFNADTCAAAKTSQTISFSAPGGGTVGDSEPLSATGGGSGNPVVFSVDPNSSPSDACSVSGTTVTFVNAGSCVIDANQAGNGAYSAAPQVSQTVSVSPATTTTTTTTSTNTTSTNTTGSTTATTAAASTTTTAATSTPPPVLGESSDVSKTSGTVQVELPGTHKFVTVSASQQVPFGAVINATSGTVTATIALPGGGTSTATFWAGEFTLSQSSSGALTAKLVDGSSAGCPASEKASKHSSGPRAAHELGLAKVTKKKPGAVVGSLWTNAKGSYTTSGKNGSAAVLGTEWLTRDQCDGTFFQVLKTSNDPHGEIRVTVLHPHKHTVLLKRGHSLLAPAPGFS